MSEAGAGKTYECRAQQEKLWKTGGKSDYALKKLSKALADQLRRARIIVTTRPVPIDRELIVTHLPVPVPVPVSVPVSEEADPTAKAFADMVMGHKKDKPADDVAPKLWRNVGLMPLSPEQMREFATLQGVSDPDALLNDIRQRNTEEFSERPQDLVELCSDWREHHRIRSHCEQVETNIGGEGP